MARTFGIPEARLNSAAGSSVKIATPDDLANFENSNAAEVDALLLKLDELLRALDPQSPHTAVFSLRLPQQREPTIEETLALLEHQVITVQEARTMARKRHSHHFTAAPPASVPDLAEAVTLVEHEVCFPAACKIETDGP